MKIKCAMTIERSSKGLQDLFLFTSETAQKRKINKTNKSHFNSAIEKIIQEGKLLKFITTGENVEFAEQILKNAEYLYKKGSRFLYKDPSNEEAHNFIYKKVKEISDYIFLILENPDNFKDYVLKEGEGVESVFSSTELDWDRDKVIEIASSLTFKNKRTTEKDDLTFHIFQDGLQGGEFLVNFKDQIETTSDIKLYGIDTRSNGTKSLRKGIQTAREGLKASSKEWADLAIHNLEKYSFRSGSNHFNLSKMSEIVKRDGMMFLVLPFYAFNEVFGLLTRLESCLIDHVINLEDDYGNMLLIIKPHVRGQKQANKNLIRRIMLAPETFPTSLEEDLIHRSETSEKPKLFRAVYTTMEDLKLEFSDHESSSQFCIDYFEEDDKFENVGRPLQEIRPGHIPTLATTGVVSGRYVDEVMGALTGHNMGFDNIIETKIIKRENEEEVDAIHNGVAVKEITTKKSNIIVSTALTTQGEFIELFSNETESDKTK